MGENIKNQEDKAFDGDLLDDLTDEEYAQQVKKVRKTVLLSIGAVIILIFVILGVGLWRSLVVVPNKAVATVGDSEITVTQYQTRVRYYRWQLLQEYARVNTIVSSQGDYDGNQYATLELINTLLTEPGDLGQRALDSLIEDAIIQSTADELGIVIQEEEIDQAFYERLSAASPLSTRYTEALYQQDYAEYLEKNAVADLTEADARAMRGNLLLRARVFAAVTADMPEDEGKRFFAEWMDDQRALLTIIIDEKLIEKVTPMEPSFNDPKVFEALFGISFEDS